MEQNDKDLIVLLATSSASLDRSPKKNWVENAGGLPPYVRKLARAIAKNGHSLESAIAIAISRVKKWAAGGGDVSAETRAKAVKALAQWEKTKANNAAGKIVKASREDGTEYLMLSNGSFNTEIVRAAWDAIQREKRELFERAHSHFSEGDRISNGFQYQWIVELGSDYVIVNEDDTSGQTRYRIPYTVDEDDDVTFLWDQQQRIRQVWVEDDDDDTLTLSEARELSDVLVTLSTPLERITRAAKRLV